MTAPTYEVNETLFKLKSIKDRRNPDHHPYIPLKEQTLVDCLTFYKFYPWIKDRVKSVWVLPISANFDETFYIRDEQYLNRNDVWFKPKEKFFLLQCNASSKRFLNSDLHIYVDEPIKGIAKGTYIFRLGTMRATKGFVVHDDEILSLERDYIDTWAGNYHNVREALLERQDIPDVVLKVIYQHLSSSLGNISEKIYTERVLHNVLNALALNNTRNPNGPPVLGTRDIIMQTASLLVYIDLDIKFVGKSVFIERLRRGFYKPEILPYLSPSEKLPEIYEDPRVPANTREQVTEKIHKQCLDISNQIIESIMTYGMIPARKATRPERRPAVNHNIIIGFPDWKQVCTNSDDVYDIPDEELIFYSEPGGNVYCFKIHELLKQFANRNNRNPYTKNNFSDEFVKRILSIYSKPVNPPPINVTTPNRKNEGRLIMLIKAKLNQLKGVTEAFSVEVPTTKCFKCNEAIKGPGMVSVYKGKQITFCNAECFED